MASLEGYRPRVETASTIRVQNRNLHPVSVEREIIAPELAREVIKINAKGPSEQRIYGLEGTGFHVGTQIHLLIENHKAGVPLADSITQIEQDIHGFNIEYLKEAPVFGIPLEFAYKNGEKKVVGKHYGGKLWEDTTDGIEREGVVKESVKKIADRLPHARPGTVFTFHSGEGWSNYQARDKDLQPLNEQDIKKGIAQEVRYPDAQNYVVTVNPDGSLTALTLKAHMSLSQSEEFLATLQGITSPDTSELSEKTRIKQVVGTVLEFSPEEDKNIDYIVKKLKHIVGKNAAYTDSSGRDRTFDEMMFMARNPENLEKLDGVTQQLTDKFASYVEWRMGLQDEMLQSDLQIALGYTVLKLMHEVRGPVREQTLEIGRVYPVNEVQELLPFDPRATLEEMQKLPGCAGGGNNLKIDSVTPRAGVLGGDEHGELSFVCPDCNKVNTREKGKLLEACQHCKSKNVGCKDGEVSSDKRPISIEEKRKKPQELKKAA